MQAARHQRKLRVLLLLFLPACLVFWIITAPASMAIQRIAAGTGSDPFARFVIKAADWYEAPMERFYKIPGVKRMNDSLTDIWCEVLAAPETTP
jgi:hypothetical protein